MSGQLVAGTLPEMVGFQRMQERRELQDLNTRVSNYITTVRNLKEQATYVDSSAFVQSINTLEDEIIRLRNMYENELENCRRQLDDLQREKSHFQMDANKNGGLSAQLQDQLILESNKVRDLHDHLNQLQRKLSDKETELVEARLAINKPIGDLQQVERDYDNVYRENTDLKRRYEHETLQRQDADEKVHQLERKLEFQETVSAQQINELRDRLEISTNNILILESKIRELSIQDNNLPELLTRVREQAEWEVARFKEESEVNFNRELTNMRERLDIDQRTHAAINEENKKLHLQLDDLQSKIRQLQTLVTSLDTQKQSLEDTIDIERKRSHDHIHTLERRMTDLQNELFNKMSEANAARDMQIPLKTEIESLRALLEEEEKRLRLPLNVPSKTPTVIPPLAPVFNTLKQSPLAPVTMPNLTPVYTTPTVYPSPPAPITNYTGMTSFGIPTPSAAPLNVNGIMTTPLTRPGMTSTPTSPRVNFDLLPSQPSAPLPRSASPALEDVHRVDLELNDTMPDILTVDPQGSPPRPLGPIKSSLVPSGPVRIRSAPAHMRTKTKERLVPSYLGQGKDYFDEMFNDLKRDTLQISRPRSSPVRERPQSARRERPQSSTSHDYTIATSSAIGSLKILELNPDGKYIRLLNNHEKVDEEIGGYLIQQNVGGHPVAVYRFPPRTRCQANTTVTVWAGCNNPIVHQPPKDFYWEEQEKWGTGPECTTILCKPNGQAVAWTTAAHRFTKDAYENSIERNSPVIPEEQGDSDMEEGGVEIEPSPEDPPLTETTVNPNSARPDPVFLRREKTSPPSLAAQKHPHGGQTMADTHPNSGTERPRILGNDNSSVNRQSRSQTYRPDPISGQPYAGASAQRLGSAPLRRYTPPSVGRTASGTRRPANSSDLWMTSEAPCSFSRPRTRFITGLNQLQSQHNLEHNPPMPRPPLFSTW